MDCMDWGSYRDEPEADAPPAPDFRDLAKRLAEALQTAMQYPCGQYCGKVHTLACEDRSALLAEAEAAVGRRPAAPAATADWDDQHRG